MITQEFIFAALDAEKTGNTFPIDFEDVWQELGYASKQKGKNALIANLIENEDYFIDKTSRLNMSTIGLTAVEARTLLSRKEIIKLS